MTDKFLPITGMFSGLENNPPQERHWQAEGQLLRVLVGKLLEQDQYQAPVLVNNLMVLHKALCEGVGVVQLQTVLNDVSAGIVAHEGVANKQAGEDAQHGPGKTLATEQQIQMICDVFVVLLDNINFPSRYLTQIDEIKLLISKPDTSGVQSNFLMGMTSLAEVLDDIFDAVKQDRKNVESYLKQLTSEIKNLDEGIVASNRLQAEKQQAEDSINTRVETAVKGIETNLSTMVDLTAVKSSLQKSLGTIRVQMDNFKQQESQRNQRATEVTNMLARRLRKMEQECQDLKQQVLEKHQQVLSDSLTGVRNRLAYEEAIRHEVKRFRRYARPVSILLLDLDNFKEFNDTHGDDAGDKALILATRMLAKNIRSVDFLARYGGDQFVIIFPELNLKDAKTIADKISRAVAGSQLEYDGVGLTLTISGGVAQLHADDTAESLLERAGAALSTAKERGRNRCEAKPH